MTSAAQAGFTTRDVIYHSPGGAPLLARLYIPDGAGPFPAVVGVHGGRWCAETRLTNEPIDQALAASGVFVMALDFRMPPLVKFPLPSLSRMILASGLSLLMTMSRSPSPSRSASAPV